MEPQIAVRTSRPTRRAFLEKAQIERFFSLGWLLLPRLFKPREIKRMRRAFDRLGRRAERLPTGGDYRGSRFVIDREGLHGAVRIHRVAWCGACEPVLAEYGADPRLLRPVAELLGSPTMNQLINQAHFKMPGDGVMFGPYTFHSSEPHRSDHPRRALINGYSACGANRRIYPGCGSGRLLCAD